jgi:hypothetical protein
MMEPDANCPDRARDGIQHLQAAAREMIHAARALLDVAEDLIDDPAAVATLVGALGAIGDAARRRARRHRRAGSRRRAGRAGARARRGR